MRLGPKFQQLSHCFTLGMHIVLYFRTHRQKNFTESKKSIIALVLNFSARSSLYLFNNIHFHDDIGKVRKMPIKPT